VEEKDTSILVARVCDENQVEILGHCLCTAVAEGVKVKTYYKRDFEDYVCWFVEIEN